MHDCLKDAVHHDVLQQHVLADVVRGSQHDQEKTQTQILEAGCSTREREREHTCLLREHMRHKANAGFTCLYTLHLTCLLCLAFLPR